MTMVRCIYSNRWIMPSCYFTFNNQFDGVSLALTPGPTAIPDVEFHPALPQGRMMVMRSTVLWEGYFWTAFIPGTSFGSKQQFGQVFKGCRVDVPDIPFKELLLPIARKKGGSPSLWRDHTTHMRVRPTSWGILVFSTSWSSWIIWQCFGLWGVIWRHGVCLSWLHLVTVICWEVLSMRFQFFPGRLPVICVLLCLDVSRMRLPTVWAVE